VLLSNGGSRSESVSHTDSAAWYYSGSNAHHRVIMAALAATGDVVC